MSIIYYSYRHQANAWGNIFSPKLGLSSLHNFNERASGLPTNIKAIFNC